MDARKTAWDRLMTYRFEDADSDRLSIETIDALTYARDMLATQQSRLEALEKEQSAWRKFTDEANRTLEAADKKIATLQARIEALEAERRWMPFEKPEQLPQTMWALNYSDPILVAILSGKTRFVRDDRYDFVQDRWDSGCVGVTHWMPLPEPPEAEK